METENNLTETEARAKLDAAWEKHQQALNSGNRRRIAAAAKSVQEWGGIVLQCVETEE